MTFFRRRLQNVLAVFIVALALLVIHETYRIALYQEQFLSGWLLFLAVLLLIAYNARKHISVLPIWDSAKWLQLHIYLGLLSILLFLLHIGWNIPNGWLEGLLAVFFIGAALSGIIGLYLSRRLARLLTRRGEEMIFERIPGFIVELRRKAEDLVLECSSATGSSTISDYYTAELSPFFSGPKNLVHHLRGSQMALFNMVKQIENMDRYLNEMERQFSDRLRQVIEKKDELDYQYALQATLKGWLFFHIPLSYGVVIVGTIHLVLVYAFTGGI